MAMTHRSLPARSVTWASDAAWSTLTVVEEQRLVRQLVAGRQAAARLTGRGAAPALVAQVARGRLARERLVAAHLPLVARMAASFAQLGVDVEDLRQEGVVGLLTGLDRFEPAHQVRVTTYVRWWIRAAIDGALAQRYVTTLPRAVQRAARAYRRAALVEAAGGEPPAARRGEPGLLATVSPATLRSALDAMRPPVRLDSQPDAADGAPATAVAVPDERATAELEAVLDDALLVPGTPAPTTLLDDIPSPRTRHILALRFGLNGPPHSRREVAAQLGLSVERVRQLEVAGLATLRAALCPDRTRPERTAVPRAS